MKKLFTFTLIFISSMVFISCHHGNTKNTPIRELRSLCTQLNKDLDNYSEQDWDKIVQKYEEIEALISEYEGQYSEEELNEIVRLKGKCVGIFTKKVVDSASEKIEDATKQVGSILEGFLEGINDSEK